MGSEEAYKKLSSLINISYYIGPAGQEAIQDACCGEEDSEGPEQDSDIPDSETLDDLTNTGD